MQRNLDSKKGDNGKVLVIGGSKEYVGAPYFAAMAALRTGIDLVYVAAPERVAWVLNTFSPDLITIKCKGEYLRQTHYAEIEKIAKKCDVVIIGPGLTEKSNALIKKILMLKMPKVIDAQAVSQCKLTQLNNSVLTPHKKEYEILLKNNSEKDLTVHKKLKNNTILLKGAIDKIITKKETRNISTGNPGMTVGGTGDILAGLVAGILAQSNNLEYSAIKAVRINGLLAHIGKKFYKYNYLASDLLEYLKTYSKVLFED